MSTPDLKVLVGLFSNEKTKPQEFYIDWMTRKFLPNVTSCKEVFLINNAFRAWGHQFLYDRETIDDEKGGVPKYEILSARRK